MATVLEIYPKLKTPYSQAITDSSAGLTADTCAEIEAANTLVQAPTATSKTKGPEVLLPGLFRYRESDGIRRESPLPQQGASKGRLSWPESFGL